MIAVDWESFEVFCWSLSYDYREYLEKHHVGQVSTEAVSRFEYDRIYRQCNQALEEDNEG